MDASNASLNKGEVDVTDIIARAVWPWRYDNAVSGLRDLRLDFLRGYCIFSMVVDHATGPNNWLYSITGKSQLTLVTGANGFVLISGVTMGMVYYRRIMRDGLGKVTESLLRRVVLLYAVVVGLALLSEAIAKHTTLLGGPDALPAPLKFLVGVLTLHTGTEGVLSMYVLLVALTPLLFFLFERGKAWLVLGVSSLIWVGNIFYPDQFSQPFYVYFPLAAWQPIFVVGLVAGYYRNQLTALLKGWWRVLCVVLIVSVATLLFLINLAVVAGILTQLFPGRNFDRLTDNMYDWELMLPLRMLATFTWFATFYLLTTVLWKPLQAALGWFLIPLGQVALGIYAVHLLVLQLFVLIPGVNMLSSLLFGFALLALLLVFWAAVKLRPIYPKMQRSTLAAALALVLLALFVPSRYPAPTNDVAASGTAGNSTPLLVTVDAGALNAEGVTAVADLLHVIAPPGSCNRSSYLPQQTVDIINMGTPLLTTRDAHVAVTAIAVRTTTEKIIIVLANGTDVEQAAPITVANLTFGTDAANSDVQLIAPSRTDPCTAATVGSQNRIVTPGNTANVQMTLPPGTLAVITLERGG